MKLLTIIFLINFTVIFAQTKVEYEKKVEESSVPEIAREELYKCFTEETRVKWFSQKDDKKEVFEAKFSLNGKYHSVEFDLDGEIENVEILLTDKEIDDKILEMISKELSKKYSDYTILKIQKAYYGDDDELFDVIGEELIDDDIEVEFEIEVNIKQNKQRQLFEITMDDDFEIIRKRKIKLQSTDILDY
jgi:hypothetical protein